MRGAVSVLLLSLLASSVAGAADPAPARASARSSPQGDTWASIAKLPDWSGVWDFDYSRGGLDRPAPPHLTPAFAAKFAAYQQAQKHGLNQQTETANCVPPGMPQIMAQPYPIEFLFTPGKVTVAIEAYSQMRRIFTDGRKHPADPDPTFQGNSIGHWEGDTLVVDTVGFVPSTLIAPGVSHSDQMHIRERFHLVAPDVLHDEITVEDPVTLEQPWTYTFAYKHTPGYQMLEYVCDNNREYVDDKGVTRMRLQNH